MLIEMILVAAAAAEQRESLQILRVVVVGNI